MYSKIFLVETKYIICIIFIDVSVCAKEERECSVERLCEQECIAYSGCTCRTYENCVSGRRVSELVSSRADERIKRSVLFAFVAVNTLHAIF